MTSDQKTCEVTPLFLPTQPDPRVVDIPSVSLCALVSNHNVP